MSIYVQEWASDILIAKSHDAPTTAKPLVETAKIYSPDFELS